MQQSYNLSYSIQCFFARFHHFLISYFSFLSKKIIIMEGHAMHLPFSYFGLVYYRVAFFPQFLMHKKIVVSFSPSFVFTLPP